MSDYLTPTQVANLPDGTMLAVGFPDSGGPLVGALVWVDDRPKLQLGADTGYRHSLYPIGTHISDVRVRLA